MNDAPPHNRTALALYLTTVLGVPLCTTLLSTTGGIENPGLWNACVRGRTGLSTIVAATPNTQQPRSSQDSSDTADQGTPPNLTAGTAEATTSFPANNHRNPSDRERKPPMNNPSNDTLIDAVTQATMSHRIAWRMNANGHPEAHGDNTRLTLSWENRNPVLTVQSPDTGPSYRILSENHSTLKDLAAVAQAQVGMNTATFRHTSSELKISHRLAAPFDKDDLGDLISALSHATRTHALTWHRIAAPGITCHVTSTLDHQFHLTRPSPGLHDEPLYLSASHKGRPLTAATAPAREGTRLSPLGKLLDCIQLANAETAREILENLARSHDEQLEHIIAGLI